MKNPRILLVIDVQRDFISGPLAVPNARNIISYINSIGDDYDIIYSTIDWHPEIHGSFASNHSGQKPFNEIKLHGIPQILWPDHCIQNTLGATPCPGLRIRVDEYFYKGQDERYDSYSGIKDANGQKTILHKSLTALEVKEIDVVGLATDYCVKFTVFDLLELGYKVNVHCEGVRAVVPGNNKHALKEMLNAGANVIL